MKIGKVAPETVAHVESLDARVEALQLLIPLGLQAVTDELQQGGGSAGRSTVSAQGWGSQLGSVYLALLLDGKSFADEQIIIALGFVQAATKNERVAVASWPTWWIVACNTKMDC